jgi:hypothetical protein
MTRRKPEVKQRFQRPGVAVAGRLMHGGVAQLHARDA